MGAKDIIASLGPEIQNPSAFVTRRCKEVSRSEPRRGDGGHRAAPMVTVFYDGISVQISWPSPEAACQQLVSRGILDDRSADFLLKLPERAAWDIVNRIGPDVRNPSAFVTRECK